MVTKMKTTERTEITSMPTAPAPKEEYFDKCKSCGQLMMKTNYQIHLITACPEWHATTLEDIRNMLISSGVHYLCEVNPGYCENCSARHIGE